MTPFGHFISPKREMPKEVPEPALPIAAPPPQMELDLAKQPNRVEVPHHAFDYITKSIWCRREKAAEFAKLALEGGYFSELCADVAQRYRNWPPHMPQAVCAYGTLLMEGNQLDAAETVFREHIAKHGEFDFVLINLAEVYSARGDRQKAIDTLWRALEINPNAQEAFERYERMQRERGGAEAGLEALRQVATLPGSWRAQLWLARHALEIRQLNEALALYRDCLAHVAKPFPAELLLQMSGDLGNFGHLPEIFQLVEPHFDARRHGVEVGNNLIKARVDLGQFNTARRILDQLYAINLPRWRKQLNFWDREIVEAERAASGPIEPSALKMVVLRSGAPVWLGPMAAELFPAKSADALVIGFLGGTAEPGAYSGRLEFRRSDDCDRMSRALPMFFAEHVELHSRARVQILMPWYCVENEHGAVIYPSKMWTDDRASDLARQGEIKCDYVVVSHLKTQAEPWGVELRLVRTIDGKCMGSLSANFPFHGRQEEMPDLAQRILRLLVEHAEVETKPASSFYQVPMGVEFSAYLRRLEYLMALRCRSMKSLQAPFLCGVRDIIDAHMGRCGVEPQNVCARLLLAETLLTTKLVQPDVLKEYRERIEKLQKEKPLAEPAHGVVQRVIDKAFGASRAGQGETQG